MSNAVYESVDFSPRRVNQSKERCLKYSIYAMTFFMCVTMIFTVLIFAEFYELGIVLRKLKNNPVLKELGSIKVGEINNVLDLLRSINFTQLKKMLSSISYDDFIYVWEGLKVCIIEKCDASMYK
jgi:hypothetical protein